MPSHPEITIPYIQKKFDDFNRQYFGNLLPPIPIKLSNAKTFLGKVCFRKKRKLFSRWHFSDFVLRINTRIDLPEDVMEDIILHEMIHYYIAVNQLQDTSAHGRLFRAEMERLKTEVMYEAPGNAKMKRVVVDVKMIKERLG